MNAVWRVLLPGAGALLVLTAGAVLLCPGGQCAVPALDASGLAAAHASRSAWLDALARGITWAGSLLVLLPVALLFAWRKSRHTGWRLASFLPLALLSATAMANLAKYLVLRPRPEFFPPLAPMPADASFPSAHAMQVTALVLAYLLRPGARPGVGEWLAGAALVLLVSYSRIHLQVHFPSDVLVGSLAAALLVLSLRELPVWRRAAS
jgi:membrane-associated phospholipid phosphatase